MRIRAVVLAASVAVCATACGPRYVWVNSQGDSSNTRYAADHGQCTAAAYQAVPVSAPIPTQQRQSSGGISTFSGSTSTGTTFSGEVVTIDQRSHVSIGQGYLNTVQQQQAIAAKDQEAYARQQVFSGCMAQRGWTLQQLRH